MESILLIKRRDYVVLLLCFSLTVYNCGFEYAYNLDVSASVLVAVSAALLLRPPLLFFVAVLVSFCIQWRARFR